MGTAKTKAAKAASLKAPAVPVSVPQSREAAAHAIAEIGRRQRERARIEAAMNDGIAALRAMAEAEALPHSLAIHELRQGVQIWCEANRYELTREGRTKTASFATGEVRWRLTPPAITIRGVGAVLVTLRNRGLTRFIRVKEEPNKEAMLADPDAVAGISGISVVSREEFVIVPHETALEEVS